MAPRDKSRLAKRSAPSLFSSTSKEKSTAKETSDPGEKKDLPTTTELYKELGLLGTQDSDKFTLRLFKRAYQSHVKEYIRQNKLSPEVLREWKDKSCQKAFGNMSKMFLVEEGPNYWPKKINPANKKRLVHLVKKLFFQHVANKRTYERRSTQKLPGSQGELDEAESNGRPKGDGRGSETAIVIDEDSDGELAIFQQSPAPEPEEKKHPTDPGLPSSDLPLANADLPPPALPVASPGLPGPYIPPTVEDVVEETLVRPEDCQPGEEADTSFEDSYIDGTIHVAPTTTLTINEKAKRPAEAELDEAQRKTKSPRKEQHNTHAPETCHKNNNNDDDDDVSFQGSEQGLYTGLLGRQRRRTRQRDYGFEDLASHGPRAFTPALGAHFGRFGTVERAVSVSQALGLVDPRQVVAPVASMMDEPAMTTIEEQDEIVRRPSPRTSVEPTQENHGGYMPEDNAGMSIEQDGTFSTPPEQTSATSESTEAPSKQDTPNTTLLHESVTSAELQHDVQIMLKSLREAPPDVPEPKVSPSPDETSPQEEADYTKIQPQEEADYNYGYAHRALAAHSLYSPGNDTLPYKFSFIVYENDQQVDSWNFSEFDFFHQALSLKLFVKVLPIQDKALLTGLTICQNGQKACMRHVYLYNEDKFRNIKDEFRADVHKDLRQAKKGGPRLDYEIIIKPIRHEKFEKVRSSW
ncbi:hypothetical protein FSARC_1362 [Fusarium sarcochroum]|uniref:Uncharacterized protein n=1 Tax=Fusarium sarcochroum TaxID=1208366 RepID=A0A8H4U8Y0_9HYPO|nr:hypothetical protein FSARC_1362 [Fusarium sarcochroum]